jgi:hypothetical protein
VEIPQIDDPQSLHFPKLFHLTATAWGVSPEVLLRLHLKLPDLGFSKPRLNALPDLPLLLGEGTRLQLV